MGYDNRRVTSRMGSITQQTLGQRHLVMVFSNSQHKRTQALHCVFSLQALFPIPAGESQIVLVRTDNMSVVYVIRQGGTHSLQVLSVAQSLLKWSREHFLSLSMYQEN